MATSSSSSLFPCYLAVPLLVLLYSSSRCSGSSCCQSIISFGDSIADTGNLVLSPGGGANHASRFPYGETYFGRPTGRFSDGRIIIDFVAEAMGLPFVPPFLGGPDGGADGFRRGVNFAVAGATALDNGFFREKGLDVDWTNCSLSVQLDWFKQLLPSLCTPGSECTDILGRSLFLVGEIGGNDYNYLFMNGGMLDEIRSSIPKVINTIVSTVTELISLGARTLVVPGNFPIGCVPMYLKKFQSESEDDYDLRTGCIKWLNEFSEYHNSMLLKELDRLRQQHPYATIIYADYYKAALSIYRSPSSFGINVTLRACCGSGDGPYNNNVVISCGSKTSNLCDDPSRYVSWDGIHLTEAAYRAIANMLLNDGSFSQPPVVNFACSQIELKVEQ
ncbi:GDSL esterase/lipase-like [Iris pallida]|uniref:GDSL esterase/lipase-like n=1 Tax=Iris pallida TaxID=29817 RepID=A0AAX6FD82_IRIPA|nr:GDSL esterase/lipase-like [Iris pallida]